MCGKLKTVPRHFSFLCLSNIFTTCFKLLFFFWNVSTFTGVYKTAGFTKSTFVSFDKQCLWVVNRCNLVFDWQERLPCTSTDRTVFLQISQLHKPQLSTVLTNILKRLSVSTLPSVYKMPVLRQSVILLPAIWLIKIIQTMCMYISVSEV